MTTDERSVYLEERRLLIDLEREAAQRFDTTMTTLAGGALALSITFIRQLVPSPTPDTITWLFASWLLFAIALLAILASLLASQAAMQRQRDILDQEHETGSRSDSQRNWSKVATACLNKVSIVSFILGVFALAYFGFANLSQIR